MHAVKNAQRRHEFFFGPGGGDVGLPTDETLFDVFVEQLFTMYSVISEYYIMVMNVISYVIMGTVYLFQLICISKRGRDRITI